MKRLLGLLAILLCLSFTQAKCIATVIDEFHSSNNVIDCPVGFATQYTNGTFTCINADLVQNSSCDNACWLDSARCYKSRCITTTRFLGDPCDGPESCFEGWCSSGICTKFNETHILGVGETCGSKNMATGEMAMCKIGLSCIQSSCVQTTTVGVGAKCNTYSEPYFRICGNGLICNPASYCERILQKGDQCTRDSSTCASGLVCRILNAESMTTTCQPPAPIGSYCYLDKDCAYADSTTMMCQDDTCMRMYRKPNGQPCTSSLDCYSSYCNDTCTEAPLLPCDIGSQFCVCQGGASSEKDGVSLGSIEMEGCKGPYYDVKVCLWKFAVTRGMTITDMTKDKRFLPGLYSEQFIDKDSLVLKTCREYYRRYYSCQAKTMKRAGMQTNGTLYGQDLKMDLSAVSYYSPAEAFPMPSPGPTPGKSNNASRNGTNPVLNTSNPNFDFTWLIVMICLICLLH